MIGERTRDGVATLKVRGVRVGRLLTTVTTVGYGDRYAVTLTGRVLAGGLMVIGVALLGIVTRRTASRTVCACREDSEAVVPLRVVVEQCALFVSGAVDRQGAEGVPELRIGREQLVDREV